MGGISNSTLPPAQGAIGSYYWGYNNTAVNITMGGTIAGASLFKLNTSGVIVSAGLTGTWMAVSGQENNASQAAPALYLRIS